MKIEIRQAEGRADSPYINRWMSFNSVREANRFLRQQAYDAPPAGGYNKHDFKITLKNGYVYEGRLDVSYKGDDTDIIKHVGQIESYLKTQKQPTGKFTKIRKELELNQKKGGWSGEFMEYYKGDPSVGIPSATAEQTRDELLKDAKTSEDKRLINEIYREVKQQERKEGKYWRQEYKQWKKENPTEYRDLKKRNRSYGQKQRWKKQSEMSTNRGQGGYFRHRPEHSINRRKAYARKGR